MKLAKDVFFLTLIQNQKDDLKKKEILLTRLKWQWGYFHQQQGQHYWTHQLDSSENHQWRAQSEPTC